MTDDTIDSFDSNIVETQKQLETYRNKSHIPSRWHHDGPCIPSLRRLFVNTAGNLYVCEKCIEEEQFRIGDIFNGLLLEKIEYLMNIGKFTEHECAFCWAQRFCSLCMLFCFDVEKHTITREKKLIACEQIKSNTLTFLKKSIIERSAK